MSRNTVDQGTMEKFYTVEEYATTVFQRCWGDVVRLLQLGKLRRKPLAILDFRGSTRHLSYRTRSDIGDLVSAGLLTLEAYEDDLLRTEQLTLGLIDIEEYRAGGEFDGEDWY